MAVCTQLQVPGEVSPAQFDVNSSHGNSSSLFETFKNLLAVSSRYPVVPLHLLQ
jgi:hypothetical protein